MDATTTLTGILPAIVLVSAALTGVVSVFLLWLYRRMTIRTMGQSVHAAEPKTKPGAVKESASTVAVGLAVVDQTSEQSSVVSAAAEKAFIRARSALRKNAIVYTLGGFAYAVIFVAAWLITAGDGFTFGRALWLFVCFAWPTALTISLVAATTRGQRIRIVCGYFAGMVAVVVFVLVINPGVPLRSFAYTWLYVNAASTLLLLTFLHKRIRAVGALVLVFVTAGVGGAILGVMFARNNDSVLYGIAVVGDTLGLSAPAVLFLMLLTGFVVLGLFGWLGLRWIGRRYRYKQLSDQSLMIDSLWMLFAVVQSIIFAFEGWAWAFTGVVAFAAYKLVTNIGFGLMKRETADDIDTPNLLLLRVFALGRRSEQFFDAFSKLWRRSGSISLIAGPDLVTTAVEPHEFLDFVSRKLSRHFVQGDKDLDRRIAELDTMPDPDGRFRVNEFYCHADTWQMTMRRLAAVCDATLMDLRSFTRANQGCLYELEQLLNIVDLESVVFLVDSTTDREFLEESLHRLWQQVDPNSPNRSFASPAVRLFTASDRSIQSMKALHLRLFRA